MIKGINMRLEDFVMKFGVECPEFMEDLEIEDEWIDSIYDGESNGVHKWIISTKTEYKTFCFNEVGDYMYQIFDSKNLEKPCIIEKSVDNHYMIIFD